MHACQAFLWHHVRSPVVYKVVDLAKVQRWVQLGRLQNNQVITMKASDAFTRLHTGT